MKKEDANFLPPELAARLDASASSGLATYLDQLLAWNRVLNLSGFDSRERIVGELVVDSFYLADFLSSLFPGAASPHCIDLGAGAGLPGVPLRLLWQTGYYTMVEVREKRALFLSNILSSLKLPRTKVFRGMAEKFLASEARSKTPDCILSRAFMPWPKLGEFCRPYLDESSFLLIMANQKAPEDLGNWLLFRDFSYQVNDRTRWLWALRKAGDAHK